MKGEVRMVDIYNSCNPCEKKEKKDECCCNVDIVVNCDCEDKKPWPCDDKGGHDYKKKCDGCNVEVIVNCGCEDKKPWPCDDKGGYDCKKKCDGCNVTITINCKKDKDCKNCCPL